MTGWNMPPGVSERDIPGNRPEDQRAEAFYTALEDKAAEFGEKVPEGKLADWLWEQVCAEYARGYGDGVTDESMARAAGEPR